MATLEPSLDLVFRRLDGQLSFNRIRTLWNGNRFSVVPDHTTPLPSVVTGPDHSAVRVTLLYIPRAGSTYIRFRVPPHGSYYRIRSPARANIEKRSSPSRCRYFYPRGTSTSFGENTETSDGPTIKPAGMVRESPNVILVTIDTLRPDRLGRWGYERNVTPGLDSLASVGLVFTNVSAPMPATAPSIASLLTGCYPNAHGVRRNGWPFSNRVESLASMLQHAGYETGAAVSVAHLAGEYGWNRGFQWFDNQGVYDRLFPYSGTHILRAIMRILPIRYERRAEQSIRNAIHWLETTRGPFFSVASSVGSPLSVYAS